MYTFTNMYIQLNIHTTNTPRHRCSHTHTRLCVPFLSDTDLQHPALLHLAQTTCPVQSRHGGTFAPTAPVPLNPTELQFQGIHPREHSGFLFAKPLSCSWGRGRWGSNKNGRSFLASGLLRIPRWPSRGCQQPPPSSASLYNLW